MNLIIDGAERTGADEFAELVALGFDETKTIKEPNSESSVSPEFFARGVLNGLNSSSVHVWESSWISAILKQEQSFLRVNEFEYEFLCRRLLNNRAGAFIVLPESLELYMNQFPSSEVEDDYVPEEELDFRYKFLLGYAQRWNYNLVFHDYDWESKRGKEQIVLARYATMVPKLPFSAKDYIGSRNPLITFVGDIRQEFPFEVHPFHSRTISKYFKQFGEDAINNFGYCSTDGYIKIHQSPGWKHLIKRPIPIGGKATHLLNGNNRIQANMETGFVDDVYEFVEQVFEIAASMKVWFGTHPKELI